MKKENAIFRLQSIDNYLKRQNDYSERNHDAIMMAIEALKEHRPHGECGTCKHYVKGGLDGKTYVCEHPSIDQDDYFNYAFLTMDENDFCSCYEKKEGEAE